jgi:hypothetical protein
MTPHGTANPMLRRIRASLRRLHRGRVALAIKDHLDRAPVLLLPVYPPTEGNALTALDRFVGHSRDFIFAGRRGMDAGLAGCGRKLVELMQSLSIAAFSWHHVEEWRGAWRGNAMSNDEVSPRIDGMRTGWAA